MNARKKAINLFASCCFMPLSYYLHNNKADGTYPDRFDQITRTINYIFFNLVTFIYNVLI